MVQASDDGKNVLIKGMKRILVVNTQTGKVRNFLNGTNIVEFGPDFKAWRTYGGRTPSRSCYENAIKVVDDDCGCLVKGKSNNTQAQQNLDVLKDVGFAALCPAPYFNKTEWDKYAPEIKSGQISKTQARVYLKRFQAGGFDEKIHMPILMAILKSDVVEKNSYEVAEALKSLKPDLMAPLYSTYNLQNRLAKNVSADAKSCRDEAAKAKDGVLLSELATMAVNPFTVDSTDSLAKFLPFRDELSKMPKEKKDAMIDGLATGLSQAAAKSAEFDGVFQSKLYYYAKKYVLSLFGESAKEASDLAIAVRNGKNTPIVVSSSPLKQGDKVNLENVLSQSSPFGFYFENKPDISTPANTREGTQIKKTMSWQNEQGKFSADLNMKVLGPLEKVVSRASSPDYAKMKKDGALTGMMIVGANLSGQAGLVDSYMNYYQSQGFKFIKSTSSDGVEFFKNKVKSGELDYLIKEAHSDGDERNLFRAAQKVNILEGTRKRSDGVLEKIYLVNPNTQEYGSDKLISNQDFGDWVRSRSKDQPLVYFNASCNSSRKVIAEITAAHSTNLVPIASNSSVYTFENKATNTEKIMLDAFRNEKSYQEMRTDMEKSEKYKSKSGDVFLFPDEEDYEKNIRKNLKLNLDIKVTVKDKNGKEVHADENTDH
jgi:hypothetical protein